MSDKWIITLFPQMSGVPLGDNALCVLIQHDNPLGDVEDTLEFVRYNDHGRPKTFVKMDNKIV